MKIVNRVLMSLTALALVSMFGHAAQAGSLLDMPGIAPDFQAIIGGSEVASGDPVASSTVLIVGKDGESTFICSGSIIDRDLVLTAAHCLGTDGLAKVVVAFRTKLSGQGDVIRVVDRRRPTDFLERAGSNESDWHDLAMIRLASPIPAGYTVAKVLPTDSLRTGSTVTLAGYGMNVPLSPPQGEDSGAGTLRKVDQSIINSSFGDTEFLVSLKDNRGACHGDSGGPAYFRQGNDLYLIGVASRMTEKDRVANNGDANDFSCSVEMVYTNVIKQADWINRAMKELHGGN